ncbi:hypothetical protein SCLCIDRAFT_1219343 [Scleroderma citrinum Foug A]|uniref:Uncharacterized protein n=1 Tax=Scleroderma citrinum Foug A TaxID=1036808 RepID=A0A0C2ZYY6_9AGAM|nr:hypothetical protein SCLCIDRAFT_1219343 [Scleroderma citrinum Foug A]
MSRASPQNSTTSRLPGNGYLPGTSSVDMIWQGPQTVRSPFLTPTATIFTPSC